MNKEFSYQTFSTRYSTKTTKNQQQLYGERDTIKRHETTKDSHKSNPIVTAEQKPNTP